MTDSGWLTRHLADIGYANPDGIGRAARLQRCEHCGAQVLRGLDGDRAAAVATTDPHEIDAVGEYVAKRIGLMTYSLRRGFGKNGEICTLSPRFIWDLRAPRKHPVLAEHRCGMQIPPSREPSLWRQSPKPQHHDDSEIPF